MKLKKIILVTIFLFSISVNAFSQLSDGGDIVMNLEGNSPVWEGNQVSYYFSYTLADPNSLSLLDFSINVTNGQVDYQNISSTDEFKHILITWNCLATSGDITITENHFGAVFSKNVNIYTYQSHGTDFCKYAIPTNQSSTVNTAPTELSVLHPNLNACNSSYNAVFQWQEAQVVSGTVQTFSDISGATNETYLPSSTSVVTIAYRRKTNINYINQLGDPVNEDFVSSNAIINWVTGDPETNNNTAITITGPDNVSEGDIETYLIRYRSDLDIHSLFFLPRISGGYIISYNLDPTDFTLRSMFVKVKWQCGAAQGRVRISEFNSQITSDLYVNIISYYNNPDLFCIRPDPLMQQLFVDETPSPLNVRYCTQSCNSFYGFTYQWESDQAAYPNFSPLIGETNEILQTPTYNGTAVIQYHRLTTVYVEINGIPQYVTIPSNNFYVGFYEHVNPGNISGGGFINYSLQPQITQIPASLGMCGTSYDYEWQISFDNGDWVEYSHDEAFPTSGFLSDVNFRIRRKVNCGTEEAYTNEIEFFVTTVLQGGHIYAGGSTTIPYNSIPNITDDPATGGNCFPADYIYTWERSVDNGPWEVISSGIGAAYQHYPSTVPLIGNSKFRRKVSCNGQEAYAYTDISGDDPGFLIFTMSPYVSPYVENLNYIRINDIAIPGVTSFPQADHLATGDKIQSTTYFDGSYRPIQKVSKETSEISTDNWGDNVIHIEYDAAGRSPSTFLPFSSSNTIGKFKSNAAIEQEAYIHTRYNEPTTAPTYSATTFDNSPLNRVVQTKGPGSGLSTVNNSVDYEFNTIEEDIKIWKIDYTLNAIPELNGVYSTGSLNKRISIDEKGKKVYEYTDFSGNIILKKVQIDNVISDNEYNGWLCTFYVYDDLGQLRSTITPKAVKYLLQNNWVFVSIDVYNELCFYNEFDERGRIIIKHSAGAGEVHTVFDNRDRVVLSQDEKQRQRKQWSFSLYDKENRNIVTGLFDNADPTIDRAAYQTYAKSLNNSEIPLILYTGQNENIIAYNPIVGNNTLGLGYTHLVINTVEYFDNYDYQGKKNFNTDFEFASTTNLYVEPSQTTKRVYSISTGSKVRVIDDKYDNNVLSDEKFLVSTVYYDEKGRLFQSLKDNIKDGVDYNTIQYDFAGKTLSLCNKQNFTASYSGVTTITSIEYNRVGQTLSVSKKYHTNNYKKIVSYSYDDMGRMKQKILSPEFNNGSGIESLQYDFNLTGLLKGINKDYALSGSSLSQWDHYFGIYLGYENADNNFSDAQFNGNLTGIMWKAQGDNSPRKFDYVYDNVNRLTWANFTQKEKPTDGDWVNDKMDFSMSYVSYDENGNLLTMVEKGVIPGKSSPIYVDMLQYTYNTANANNWTNKLQSVKDFTWELDQTNNGLLGDFKDEVYGVDGVDYDYDVNGNLVKDNNKKIRVGSNDGIEYNFMDKPQKVTIEGKSIIEFIYDAAGEKLGKKVTNTISNQVETTWYNGDYVYEEKIVSSTTQLKLQYIINEEGRIRAFTPVNQPRVILGNNIDLPDGLKGVFEFFIKDNLQNTRAVLSEETHIEHHNCTMETSNSSTQLYEETNFGQINSNGAPLTGSNEVQETRIIKGNNPGADPLAQSWTSSSGTHASRLIGNANHQAIGPNMLMKVMAGDKLYINVEYYFNQPVDNGNNPILNQVVPIITNLISFGGQGGSVIKGSSSDISNNLSTVDGSLDQFLHNNDNNNLSTNPRAYLNWMFFDENFNFVGYDPVTGLGSSAVSVTTPGDGQRVPGQTIKVPKNGYAFIYVSNSSNINVYFDDLDIIHERGRLVEENAYYPYGLKIKGISGQALGKMDNQYGYQGSYSEMEAETGWNEFDLRMYDPQIGRWNGPDPYDEFASPYTGMGNNPTSTVDPNGGSIFGVDDLITAGVGFAVGYASSGIQTGNWGWKSVGNGVLGAASFELGYITQGGGGTGGNIATAENYVSSSLIGMLYAQSSPIQIQVGDWTFSISPTGSATSVGFNFGIGYNNGDFRGSFSYGIGYSSGTDDLSNKYKSDSKGYYHNFGISGGAGNFDASYGGVFRGGLTAQHIGYLGIRVWNFSIRIDEDFLFPGRGDKYFTGGGTLSYKVNDNLSLAVGLGMITGKPDRIHYEDSEDGSTHLVNDRNYEKPNYRGGILYGGVIYRGVAYFGGINNEKVLHKVQNWIHDRKWSGRPAYFPNMGFDSKPWSYTGSYSNSSLIY